MAKYLEGFVLLVVLFFVSARVTTPRTEEVSVTGNIESTTYDDSIPSLNKLMFPPIIYNRKDFTMNISELTVGFENMSIKKASPFLHNMSMWVEVSVPEVTIRADHYHLIYRSRMWFGLADLDNVGEFRCDIKNFKVNGTVQLGFDDYWDTVITSLSMAYSYARIQVKLSGSSLWVNKMANEHVLEILRDKEVMKMLVRVIKDEMKPYLQGYTPQEHIQMILTALNENYETDY